VGWRRVRAIGDSRNNPGKKNTEIGDKMDYQSGYRISEKINEFFGLGFKGKQMAQLTQIIIDSVEQREDTEICACKLPGFDANDPSICPTCGKPHRA
jgi:hypothetical protein